MNVRTPPLATINADAMTSDGGEEVIELGPSETSLSFLQKVYRSTKQPMSLRMRAAIEAMPHEHPRLGAVAIGSISGVDFASMLDRAIERSGKVHEVKQIEASAIDLTPAHSIGRFNKRCVSFSSGAENGFDRFCPEP